MIAKTLNAVAKRIVMRLNVTSTLPPTRRQGGRSAVVMRIAIIKNVITVHL